MCVCEFTMNIIIFLQLGNNIGVWVYGLIIYILFPTEMIIIILDWLLAVD